MREETSMLGGVLEIRVKCRCLLPNAGDLTGLLNQFYLLKKQDKNIYATLH